MNLIKYLDRCKLALGVSSNYALAKSMGIPENYISDFYKFKRTPDEYACFQIAEILKLNHAEVIAVIQIARGKNKVKLLYFKEFLDKCKAVDKFKAIYLGNVRKFTRRNDDKNRIDTGLQGDKANL